MFLENIHGVIENLRSSLEAQALLEAAEYCHLIKGGAVSIGLTGISDIAHEMVKACKVGDTLTMPKLLKRLTSIVTELEAQRKLVQ